MTTTENSLSHYVSFQFRQARATDGAALWHLVRATGALEPNSAYFYLLFATDFADTCLVAEQDGKLAGTVIGYHPPTQPGTAFVWQIGLLPACQGKGLGLQLLQQWLALPANSDCEWVTATVADDNPASQALFRRLARELGTACEVTPHFTTELFPPELDHPAEPLYRIGPIHRKPVLN